MPTKVSQTTTQWSDSHPVQVLDVLSASAGLLLLLAVVMDYSVGGPAGFGSGKLALVYIATGTLLFGVAALRSTTDPFWWVSAHLLIGSLATIFVLRQIQSYMPTQARIFYVIILFGVFVTYPFTLPKSHKFLRERWAYVLAFLLYTGVYFYHAWQAPAGASQAAYVVYAGIVVSINLFLIPRVLSFNAFLGILSTVAGGIVSIGGLAYLIGEYTVASFEVQLHNGTNQIPLAGIELHALQSTFVNPNALGVFAAAGMVAGFILTISLHENNRPLLALLTSGFVIVNGVGAFLSWSRSGWFAATVALLLFLIIKISGRAVIPKAVALLGSFVVLFLLCLFIGIIPISTAGRFHLWSGAVEAVLNSPGPFGYGVVDSGNVIAPYVADELYRGYGPHNSYLQVFVRTGVLGGFAFLCLTVGAVVHGALRWRSVNIGALTLSTMCIIIYLFEAFNMFNNALPAVISTLAFGYLIDVE